MEAGLIALIVLAVFLFVIAFTAIRIVPRRAPGSWSGSAATRTLDPGLALIIPFVDRVKPLLDLREQVVSFPPQPVITEDNLVVGIDTVIYFTITDAKAVTYEVANPLQAIETARHAAQRDRRPDAGGDADSRDNVNAARWCSTRRPASGASASTASSSSRSSRRARSRRRWRSRCAPSATGAPRSSPPRASSSRRSSPPRARSSRPS